MILRVRQLRTRVRALSRILSSYQYADPPPPSPDETAPIFLPTLHKAAWWVRAAALALGGEADYDSSPDRPGSNELWFSIPAENISDEEAEAGAGAATEQGDTRSGPPDSGDGAADPLRGGASPGLERDARRKLPQIGGGEGGGWEAVGDGVPLEKLKSFTTQAFFVCWRGVHLGLLQASFFFFSSSFVDLFVCLIGGVS